MLVYVGFGYYFDRLPGPAHGEKPEAREIRSAPRPAPKRRRTNLGSYAPVEPPYVAPPYVAPADVAYGSDMPYTVHIGDRWFGYEIREEWFGGEEDGALRDVFFLPVAGREQELDRGTMVFADAEIPEEHKEVCATLSALGGRRAFATWCGNAELGPA